MGPTIERLNDLASAWSESLLRASWQGGLAIAAAWVLVRCHLRLTPRVACWAWRLADLKLVVAVLWATPLVVPLLPPSPLPGPIAETSVPALEPPPVPAVGSEPFTEPAVGPVEPPVLHGPGLASVALLCWLCGVVGASVLAAKGWIDAGRLRRSCRPIDRLDLIHEPADPIRSSGGRGSVRAFPRGSDGASPSGGDRTATPGLCLRDAAVELAGVLGLRGVPELRAGSGVSRPMLVGAFRPAILLPIAMLDDPRSIAAIRPVLGHELAHVRRRDLLWSGLSGLVRALFFFHPLVWLAHREALVAREAACDALALRASGVRPSEYGRILLEIAAGGSERPSRWAAALGMAGPAGSLGRRLMAMKTYQPPSRRRLLSWAFALLAVGAAGIVPWRLVPRDAIAQEPAPPAKRSVPDSKAGQDPAAESKARLKLAGAHLRTARLGVKAREADLARAESDARAAAARLEYRHKQRDRLDQLVQRGAVEGRLLDEEEDRLRKAQAQEREARLHIAVAHANREAAEAAVREARAEYDIARAGSRLAPEVEADLGPEAARAERVARARANLAEADLAEAKAAHQRHQEQLDRMSELAKAGAVEQRMVDEAATRFRAAQEEQRAVEARLAAARAEIERARAAIREGEARRDLAQARPRIDGDPEGETDPKLLKEARTRLHQARVDRARSERDAARGEIDQAEASVERARTSVEYRTKQLRRLKELVAREAVEQRLVNEQERLLGQFRGLERRAEAAIGGARARLEAAEVRLKAVEAEAGGSGSGPEPKSPAHRLPFRTPSTNIPRRSFWGY